MDSLPLSQLAHLCHRGALRHREVTGLLKDAPLGTRKVERLPLCLSHWDRISEGYQAAHLNEGWSQQEPAEQSYYYQRLSCAALTLP
ncbi:hypothetical protein PBY51_018663 [Eleginops maclovinus]|uniref:Uncharacterized protein n=1 Tax=Eleginops maclovinus TaxID=56733 RepID=A0AAN8AYD2_ELEMC|nr:hypothetical protein PBY51_018663 [Eleginops maclovinus]